MKQVRWNFRVFSLFLCCIFSVSLFAQDLGGEKQDRTLSPYFFIKSDDPSVDRLPLKSTSAEVNIAGVIADVQVTQVYKNEGKKPLEAIYIFPASTRAAVYNMKMTIGERTIIAKIEKREEARQQYEEAKAEGKSASLLEQQRPNVFQMNVANIMPGDEIKVELFYTELLIPTEKIYEFVYPTVVGPRYSNQSEENAPNIEKWIENPYLTEGEAPTYTFDIRTTISAGLPIQDITCSSHEVNINYKLKSLAVVELDKKEKSSGNKDFILKYRLAGNKIEDGLLLYKGKDENFFLLMMQPPERVIEQQIPPRDYIFIVDVSGSMNGFPLNISKKLLKNLIGNLRKNDTFNMLFFAGGSNVMSENSIPATSENIARAISMLESQRGGGGTELIPALKRALAMPKNEGVSRTIIIATDGYVSVEKEAFDLIRNNLNEANMFAFGIGTGVNRYLIEGMARAGMGEPFIITKQAEADAQAEKFRKYILSPVLTKINTEYKGFDVYDVEPPTIPDVLAERPIIIFGKWRNKSQGEIIMHGYTGNRKKFNSKIKLSDISPLNSNRALKYLWARHRISMLGDYNQLAPDDEKIKEITDLGLKYNLLTEYTSFVAIDSEIRNKNGGTTTVKQPLPLPEGVSNLAVGRSPMHYQKSMGGKRGAMSNGIGGAGILGVLAAPVETEEVLTKTELKEDKKQIQCKLIDVKVSIHSIKKMIMDQMESKIEDIISCVSGKSNKVILKKKIEVEFLLTPEGTVKAVTILKNETKNRILAQCFIDVITKMKFKKPGTEKNIKVKCIFEYSG